MKKSKYHNEALNIAEMFPDTPFEELLGAFELSNGDLDSTLAYLFNKSSVTSTTTTTSTSSDKDEEPLDKKRKEKPQEPQDLIRFDDFKPLITTSTSKPVPDISLLDLALDESPSLPDSEPSDDPELEESISVIGELFPDVPRSVVRITLERCDNDVNQTLDLLLYEKTRSNFNLSGELPDFDSFNNDSSDMSNQEGLDDMNNFFGEILGSNSRNEVDESNFFTLEELEQLKIDQQFAEQLNQLEKEANLKIEQRELEDRKLALSLASQQHTNNLQLEDDELLARKLADEEAAQELAEKEKREYQQLKRIRELEDEALAKELSEKDSQELKKLKEIQLKDMELAKQLENMEKDEEIAKELQAKEDKERKRLQEEEDRKTQELINKLNNPEDPTSVIDHNDREYLKEFSKELGKFKLKQLLGGNCKVEKVWRSDLAENFEAKWTQLKSKYHFDPILTKAEIAFHGTREGNIPNIVRNGLIVPGTHGITHATDSGWFGKGIYLSPDPNYSVGYCAGGGKLLVCAVLMGKRFVCPNVMHGCSLKSGFDSHTSPDGKEFVLFSSSHVLPLFVIHFKDVNTNYNYDDYNYYVPPVVVPMIKHPPPPPATTWWSGLMKQHKEPHKKWQGKKKR